LSAIRVGQDDLRQADPAALRREPGRILIDGQDIADASQASLRSQIAIVQQEPILFHRSLAENIAYGRPGASQAEIEHAARLRARTISSFGCPRAIRRWSASAASSSRAASASASRSPAPSWPMRRS
jgi:ABC-type branched-subunit amino acid transport system ATPase component